MPFMPFPVTTEGASLLGFFFKTQIDCIVGGLVHFVRIRIRPMKKTGSDVENGSKVFFMVS
jgi:hypothetical protein